MELESKALIPSRRQFKVELASDEVEAAFDHALQRLAQSVKLQGFRPGKAPLPLVRQQLEPEKLRQEAYSIAVGKAWQQIVKQLNEAPIQDPEVQLETFEQGKPAKVTFEFDIRPQVSVGRWQKIKLKAARDEAVSDKEVEAMITSLSQAHAKTRIKLAPAAKGDKVDVSFEGSIRGVRQDKLTSKNFPLVLGGSNTIPGFEDQLLGLKKGKKKKFQLRFPKDHFDKNLADQLVDFEAEIDEVFEVILPELNQEFAEHFGHKTTAALRKAIRQDIASRKQNEQFVTQKAKWLAEFQKLVKTEVPKTLIDAEVARSREQFEKFLTGRSLTQENWLKDRGLTLEKLEADWQAAAHSSVTIGLGLAEVAKELKKELKSNEEFQELLDELVRKAIAK